MAEPFTEKTHKFGAFGAVGFVLLGIAFWYVFVYLAQRVAVCAAAGEWWPFTQACSNKITSNFKRDFTIVIATLPFAMRASSRIFFPPED